LKLLTLNVQELVKMAKAN